MRKSFFYSTISAWHGIYHVLYDSVPDAFFRWYSPITRFTMLSTASVFVAGLPTVHNLALLDSGDIEYSGSNNKTIAYAQRPALQATSDIIISIFVQDGMQRHVFSWKANHSLFSIRMSIIYLMYIMN